MSPTLITEERLKKLEEMLADDSTLMDALTEYVSIRDLCSDLRRDRKALEGYKLENRDLKRELEAEIERRKRLQAERDGAIHLWEGDGSDDPESLACPVLIHPEDLRKIL